MAVQATGNSQSGGLNRGSRNDKYQAIVRGCSGVGLLDALSAKGITNAAEAIAAAAGADRAARSDMLDNIV